MLQEPSYNTSVPSASPIAQPQPQQPYTPGGGFRQQPYESHQQHQQQQQQFYTNGPAPGGVSQSMFISPPSQADPLGVHGQTIGRPGSASPAMGYYPHGQGGMDPLSQSMRVQSPRRPRLDAREAASKLANFL
jgi:hypothetical protein